MPTPAGALEGNASLRTCTESRQARGARCYGSSALDSPRSGISDTEILWAMSKLTTHVLDVSAGIPGANVRIELHSVSASGPRLLSTQHTGQDGRCASPLLAGEDFQQGRYSLTFHVGEYFRSRGVSLADPPFFEQAVIHFGIARPEQHYHVPLLVTPWSYSVYRGG